MTRQTRLAAPGRLLRMAARPAFLVTAALLVSACGGSSDPPQAGGGGGGTGSGGTAGSATLQSLPGEATASHGSFLGFMRGVVQRQEDGAQPFALGNATLPTDDAASPAAL